MLVLTFQIGDNRLALDIHRVREVVPRVALRRPAASPDWLAGLFVYRGLVVPVVDLHQLLDAGPCPPHLSSRVILTPVGDSLLGLLAAHVADLRDVRPAGQPLPGIGPALGTTMADADGILHLVDLDRLLPAPLRALIPLEGGG